MKASRRLIRRAQKRANKKGRAYYVVNSDSGQKLVSDRRYKKSMDTLHSCDPEEDDKRSNKDKTATPSTRVV